MTIVSIFSHPVHLVRAVVQLVDGSVLNLVLEVDHATLQPSEVQFPALCSPVIWTVHGVLGLTIRYRLYLDNKELGSNITSLALHSNFLLATTLVHRLVSQPLSELTTWLTS